MLHNWGRSLVSLSNTVPQDVQRVSLNLDRVHGVLEDIYCEEALFESCDSLFHLRRSDHDAGDSRTKSRRAWTRHVNALRSKQEASDHEQNNVSLTCDGDVTTWHFYYRCANYMLMT